MNGKWFLDMAERASVTFAQGFVSVVTIEAITSLDASWGQTLLVGLIAGGYSIVKSIAARGVGDSTSASLLNEGGTDG